MQRFPLILPLNFEDLFNTILKLLNLLQDSTLNPKIYDFLIKLIQTDNTKYYISSQYLYEIYELIEININSASGDINYYLRNILQFYFYLFQYRTFNILTATKHFLLFLKLSQCDEIDLNLSSILFDCLIIILKK